MVEPRPLKSAVENAPDVLDVGQIGEEHDEVAQLRVVWVVEPRRDGHGIVGVEDVRRRRVVDDDRFVDRSAELREVLREGDSGRVSQARDEDDLQGEAKRSVP